MGALGYVEGNNLVIVQRHANGPEKLAGLVAEMVAAKVDVLVTSGNVASRAAKETTGSTPVVFVSGNPVESGLVVSLARPGGNMTGLSTISFGLDAKRLELLKEVLPKVSRVGVLFETRQLQSSIVQAEAAARALGLEVARRPKPVSAR
jgi:putative ABC transport system substrate-binding protein